MRFLEFLLGCDTDVAQDRASKFGEEALDEVEPGAMSGSKGEFEAVRGLIGEPGLCLFGDVRGMIVEDQFDGGVGRIGGIEKPKEFDELAAAMAILDQGMDRAGDEIDARQQGYGAMTFIFMLAGKGRMHAGFWRQIRGSRGDRLDTGLLVIGDDRHGLARLLRRYGRRLEDLHLAIDAQPRPSFPQNQDRAAPGSIALCAVSLLPGRESCMPPPAPGWRGTHVPPPVRARGHGGPKAGSSKVRADNRGLSPSGMPATPAMPCLRA
jgi:hypothetical protein